MDFYSFIKSKGDKDKRPARAGPGSFLTVKPACSGRETTGIQTRDLQHISKTKTETRT